MSYTFRCVSPEASYYVSCEAEHGSITPFMAHLLYRNLRMVDSHLQVEGDDRALSLAAKATALLAYSPAEQLAHTWQRFKSDAHLDTLYANCFNALAHDVVKTALLIKAGKATSAEEFVPLQDIPADTAIDDADVLSSLNTYHRKILSMAKLEHSLLQSDNGWQVLQSHALTSLQTHSAAQRQALSQAVDLSEEKAPLVVLDGYEEDYTDTAEAQVSQFFNQVSGLGLFRKNKKRCFRNKAADVKARKAIKRAVMLFQRFGMEEELRCFCKGEPVMLAHVDSPVKFRITAYPEKGWLHRKTVDFQARSPFNIDMLTASGEFVAKLCVYLDRTPVLDQLLGWLLCVNTGEEKVCLEKANFYAIEVGNLSKLPDTFKAQYPDLFDAERSAHYHEVENTSEMFSFRSVRNSIMDTLQRYALTYSGDWLQRVAV